MKFKTITAAVLGLSACNEDAATVHEAVETTTEAVATKATEVQNNAVEQIENIQKDGVENTTAAVTETIEALPPIWIFALNSPGAAVRSIDATTLPSITKQRKSL